MQAMPLFGDAEQARRRTGGHKSASDWLARRIRTSRSNHREGNGCCAVEAGRLIAQEWQSEGGLVRRLRERGLVKADASFSDLPRTAERCFGWRRRP